MTTTIRGGSAGTGAMALELKRSYDYCRELAKLKAKNFYYGMKLLPEPKRSAMYSLYAYMRLVDDIADDDAHMRTLGQRHEDLNQWERLTKEAMEGGAVGLATQQRGTSAVIARSAALWPAFADMVRTHQVPLKIFEDMIAGQRQDLEAVHIQTFDDLYQYCYRVASVVGIASLYVWGFEGGQDTLELAAQRGVAYQLTNILRDMREDASRADGARCYIPAEDLARFGIKAGELATPAMARSREFLEMMRFEVDRARSYYEKSGTLERKIAADSRPTLMSMTAIYRGILEKIARHPGRVLSRRVRLSKLSKVLIALRAMRGGQGR